MCWCCGGEQFSRTEKFTKWCLFLPVVQLSQVFCEGSPLFCLNLLSLCSLLLWHCCRAHLFQGQCEMISVLTNINTQPDPINKLLLVSCLARSQENLATARQVQIYWGEKSVGSTVCVCVCVQSETFCISAPCKFCVHCTNTLSVDWILSPGMLEATSSLSLPATGITLSE